MLAERYFVVMWDQRGNGLSERIEKEEYTWDSVVEEVDTIRERFAPGSRATLLGHSFGAMYAALYTSRHPERVEPLALLEPGGLNGDIFEETFDSIINVDLWDTGMNEMFWQNEVLSPASHEAMDYRALMILLNGRQTNYFCDADHPPHYPVWRPGAYVEYLRGVRTGAGSGLGKPDFEFDFAAGLDTFPRHVLIVAGTCSALGPDFQRSRSSRTRRSSRSPTRGTACSSSSSTRFSPPFKIIWQLTLARSSSDRVVADWPLCSLELLWLRGRAAFLQDSVVDRGAG